MGIQWLFVNLFSNVRYLFNCKKFILIVSNCRRGKIELNYRGKIFAKFTSESSEISLIYKKVFCQIMNGDNIDDRDHLLKMECD